MATHPLRSGYQNTTMSYSNDIATRDYSDDDELSGGYNPNNNNSFDDSEDDLNSEAREYYNSGASELVTTVRGDGYGGGGGGHHGGNNRGGYASSLQSHNYEPDESEVWRAYVAQQHFTNRGQWWTTGKLRALKRWGLTFLVGVLQAVIAITCNMASRRLGEVKFDHVYDLLAYNAMGSASPSSSSSGSMSAPTEDQYAYYTADGYLDMNQDGIPDEQQESGGGGEETDLNEYFFNFWHSPFLAFLFYQTVFATIASLFVYIEPVSGGSGIPEVKCFLNGIDLPRIVRFKTLVCKVIGVTFSVAAGLPVGKEGPMVHSGSVVAAGISQGKTRLWGKDTSFSKFSDFRNDREKRDFVACGAAAGVASAFGAPIGGVLFSLEEGASYWSTKLTWRAFFCAMVTLGTLFAIRNQDIKFGQANVDKLFSFGEFTAIGDGMVNFSVWELLLFILIGCLGGLIGACFNAGNEHLTIWRMKNVNFCKKRRVIEVVVMSLLVTTVSFVMPLIWNRCTELPTDMQDWTNQEKELVNNLVPFNCIPGKEYNEVASLFFCEADVAIRQLFHFRETGETDAATFSSAALFLFFIPYITLASLVYGIAVPSGLFVPSLLAGAAFGRLFGHLLHKLDHTSGTFADSGTYALMGAAAVLGGMARMTISLTVILLEATGNMQYCLPLMMTLMSARFVGNVFNEGLYDIHIHLKHIPFLEPDVPTIAERHEIVAGQVMSTEVKCLRPVERVGVVYDLLKNAQHGNFPIVDTASSGTLYGTASRTMLCTLLQRRAFGQPHDVNNGQNHSNTGEDYAELLGPKRLSPLVQWDTLERVYPRYPTIDDVELRPGDRNCWLDLRPYANTAPYTINETASIQRTYRLFRTLGLRFLCVVNHNNQVVGIITRVDLLPDSLSDAIMRGRNAHMVGGGLS
ncbi:CLC family voltage-gated chloride channel protein [Skeletonema marinoi]|uniref:Chloride channel protein n=1 Tax=Skeletonema marinoi TaxID=267567 RepID=A0AAD8Y4M0_9STRA|nr:CLC family voltage-gated chloride channel protein [Skeletonema marinoi]